MTLIKRSDLYETRPYHFIAEASSLGLPPGSFPLILEAAPDVGNGLRLIRQPRVLSDFESVRYFQECGCIEVVVFND